MSSAEPLIHIGKVSGTHGIRGELRVTSFSGDYETLQGLGSLQLRGKQGEVLEAEVASVRLHGGKALVTLKDLNDINSVNHLVGYDVVVCKSQLPEPEEGEFYWHDLIGLRVVTDSGEDLGVLEEIFPTGSNDVYVARNGTQEYLIPAIEEVVIGVDLAAGIMTVCPLDGLFDL